MYCRKLLIYAQRQFTLDIGVCTRDRRRTIKKKVIIFRIACFYLENDGGFRLCRMHNRNVFATQTENSQNKIIVDNEPQTASNSGEKNVFEKEKDSIFLHDSDDEKKQTDFFSFFFFSCVVWKPVTSTADTLEIIDGRKRSQQTKMGKRVNAFATSHTTKYRCFCFYASARADRHCNGSFDKFQIQFHPMKTKN